ncbi:MAG: hypothetical protein CMP91_09945 [Gammaproteobacteria bacterium]|nr:hypothetical protein [Gammaproteobacteria bacterium]MAY03751.1 hypothetical protein [Gammaproteobacteria bacterium]|tara:strand:- start:121 stop:492 length:372 start_codon:yes stop_codon:yes gene_type:complete
MKSTFKSFGLGFALFAMTSSLGFAQDRPIAGANCENPVPPSITNSSSQNMDMLLDAQDAVQGFIEASNNFIACVDRVIDRRSESASQEQLDAWTALINDNVEAQETVAAAFNEQVRMFNESQE